jgi:hypothetical protein
MTVSQNGWNTVNFFSGGKQMTSIARESCYDAVTIPTEVLQTLQTAFMLSSNLERASVESYLPDSPESRSQSATILGFLRANVQIPQDVVQTAPGIASYQFNPRTYNEDSKQKLKTFMDPILGPAPSPDSSKNNDKRCIDKRVSSLQKDAKDLDLTPSMLRHIKQFVEETQGPHKLVPVDNEVVWKKQSRPSQQHKLKQSSDAGPNTKKKVQAFQKAEAYGNANDPRNITVVPSDYKERWSCFQMAFAQLLKRWSCYAFGKPPIVIAKKVAFICNNAKSHVLITDFSRLDGTINIICRTMEESVLLMNFRKTYHEKIRQLYRQLRNQSGFTTHGVKYNVGYSRLSGDPETSNHNTLVALFVIYVAHKLQGFDSDEAWVRTQECSIAGGDDGLIADLELTHFQAACRLCGLKGTADVVQRGGEGVNFLARYYSKDVWYGALDSVTDIKRAVWKFHTTGNLPDPTLKHRKLYAKSLSLLVNDSKTPILGPLCKKAVELIDAHGSAKDKKITASEDSDISFTVRTFGNEGSYPQDGQQDWKVAFAKKQMPGFNIDKFYKWLHSATYDTILHPPRCYDEPAVIAVKDDVVINGETVKKEPKSEEKASEETPDKGKKKPKKRANKKKWQKKESTPAPASTPEEKEPIVEKPAQQESKQEEPEKAAQEDQEGGWTEVKRKQRKPKVKKVAPATNAARRKRNKAKTKGENQPPAGNGNKRKPKPAGPPPPKKQVGKSVWRRKDAPRDESA